MSSTVLKKFMENKKPKKLTIPGIFMNKPLAREVVAGDIGIEFEIEGRKLVTGGHLDGIMGEVSGSSWQSKEDGSLRGGREYVLRKPCNIDEVVPLVTGFFDRVSSSSMQIINSNRCSTHVHINVSNCKVNEITSMIALWITFEQALVNWCGLDRQKNHFCLSSNDEQGMVESWRYFLRDGSFPRGRGLKYTALNILTLRTFGSLEFRCGAASNEPTQPISWIKFLHYMCDYAKTVYANPVMLAYDMSERGPVEIFKEICEACGFDTNNSFCEDVMNSVPDFEQSCLDNFRENAQSLTLGYPWEEWMEEINKEYIPNPFSSEKALEPERTFVGVPAPRAFNEVPRFPNE